MDEYKGIVKIEIFGKIRGFKFGTMQAALFCKQMKCKLPDMSALLDGSDLEAQIVWYWSAAASYSRLAKDQEPSMDEVAAWIDTYGYAAMEAQASGAMLSPKEEALTPTTEEGLPLTGI
jgi:hypothetical protein